MASDDESSIEEVPLTQSVRPPASWIQTIAALIGKTSLIRIS